MTTHAAKKAQIEKVGPWRRVDYDSFRALDCELKLPPQKPTMTGLLGSVWDYQNLLALPSTTTQQRLADAAEAQQRLIDEAWAVRRAHPVYQLLTRDPNFKAAWTVFERRRKEASDGRLANPTVVFEFLQQVVTFAGSAYLASSHPSRSKSGGHTKDRKAAIKHADALGALLGNGLGLDDYSDTQRLSQLLKRLSSELHQTKRKKYGGTRAVERSILKSFALIMIVSCGLKSPAIVTHFANMVGLRCDEKKAQRYCNEGARTWAAYQAANLSRLP